MTCFISSYDAIQALRRSKETMPKRCRSCAIAKIVADAVALLAVVMTIAAFSLGALILQDMARFP